ncbi:MAG: hypothetical protein QM820_34760 [Minicystis sp.]
MAEEIPSIKRIDKKVVDRLTPILKKAIQSAILDHVARSFSSPPQPEPAPPPPQAPSEAAGGAPPGAASAAEGTREGIVTTPEEIEAYNIVSRIVKEKFPDAVVQYRDAKSYFTIMQTNLRKWFIRLGIEKAPFWISFRHIKPEAAQAMCPGFEVTGALGDAKVAIKGVADITRLKAIILAAHEAELARIGDPVEPVPSGEPA